ncbi:wHTH domain-containing protein [Kutzneria sp. CA-103260]|uniref:wHTH domain-containing protein n=1 Tax=Kutzneria sp. CA-103260 TaxID=2802641 RepID=UPI001BAD5D47|nr:hypothetical protein [Kutzneria sp. CA-103260]QUQ71638.1 Chaperone protein HtpG [Kutzneria sp. CA-103260]
MASGGSENSITGDVSGSVVAHVVHGDVTLNYHAGPPSDPTPAEPWAKLVHCSKVWCDGQDRTAAVAVATHLASLHQDLPADPWLDRGLADRFAKRVSWLAGKVEIEFGAAEATLLSLIPLLHQVLWTRAAVDRLDGPPPEFYRDHSRLAARMDGHDEVRWWLFHRWLWLQAEVLRPESIAVLLTDVPVPPVLTAARVSSLLQGLRLEPNVLCGKQRMVELRQRETLFGGTDAEEHVRTPLLGLLLAVAYSMSIDTTGLSDIIVWHTPVDFEGLHSTIADASWAFRADCPVLSATCHHASVVEALREHTVRLDALLHAVRQAADEHPVLAPLRSLPERASSDDVRPSTGPDGKPVFSGWSRFRMDEQRVQELLMGEQLYRDRSLAIRELYQNALDACRYRRAREEYLRRTTDRASAWSGLISFSQGIDPSGRPYLDCTDNGVGMGIPELTGVFAQAGARFADLAEFRDEQVDWSRLDPPVELYPNSRFGIGVLSYFMLADEITITTCRMSRKTGLPGPKLEVAITGPGHLFEVKEIAAQGTPGTTVRLHLRAGIQESCVETLRRLLAIAEFDTAARHGRLALRWRAGEFKPSQGLGPNSYSGYGETVTSSTGQVFWCEYGGGPLVDGLHTEIKGSHRPNYKPRGALVNLTGPTAPRLSVDRTIILDDVVAAVTELQRSAIPDLLGANTVLTYKWLSTLGFENPTLADMIVDQSPRHRCFPADASLLATEPTRTGQQRLDGSSPLNHILLWRLLATDDAGDLAELVPELTDARRLLAPMPSDVSLLCSHGGFAYSWASAEENTAPGHVFSVAAQAGMSPQEAAHRLIQLGVDGIDVSCYPADRQRSYETEMVLLSRHGDGRSPWCERGETVPGLRIRTLSAQHHISVTEAARMLSSYGLIAGPQPEIVEQGYPSLRDLVRAAIDADAHPRQLTRDTPPNLLDQGWDTVSPAVREGITPIPVGAVLSLAEQLCQPAGLVAAQIAELGLVPPDLPVKPSTEDIMLVSTRLDGLAPWLDIRRPVRLHHLIKAHAVLNLSPFWVADRLTQLGFTAPSENLPYYPELRDLTLLRVSDGGKFLDPDQPVPLAHLVSVSRQLGQHITQVADRLRELGMIVPDLGTMIREALAKVPVEK